MAARSIASLTITFGLVSIPVKPYSAYDKAYFLAPDKGGPKPYALLSQAMYPAPLQLTRGLAKEEYGQKVGSV